jgi:hypothetical protein
MFAQERSYKGKSYLDLSAGASTGKFSSALSWSYKSKLIKRLPNLQVGFGIRYTTFIASNKFYVTAPAKYTSSVQNLGTIFSKTIEANIDTITTPTANTNSLNIAIYIEYSIGKKIDVGFNIDAFGFSFGPAKTFNVISSSFDANQSPIQTGSPTRLNLLLTSDNDIGSLNSEFFARYWLNKKIALRGGISFLFSEYRLDNKLSFDGGRIMNDRYRHKAAIAIMGITYKLFK